MKRTILLKTAVAAASAGVLSAFAPAFAQDEAEAEKPAEEVVAAAETAAKPAKAFAALMRCTKASGAVQVLRPRTTDWIAATEGSYYPFGTAVRATGEGPEAPKAVFTLGDKAELVIDRAAEFATREVAIGEAARALELRGGRVTVKLPRTLGVGLFTVVAPAFACENLAGESVFDYAPTNDGDEAVVRCVTGTLSLKGAHYAIPRMGAANQIRIRTTGDQLFSSLRGESGTCKVLLDQGLGIEKNFETGEVKDVAKTLEFEMSPKCAIKIFRAKSAIGGRVSVSTMTFGASGDMLNRIVFAEGLSSINSGELVISPKIPEGVKGAKKAKAAADEDDDAETVEDDAPAEKADDDKKTEKKADDDDEI